MGTLELALWYANTAVTLILLVRLRRSGLAGVYRWFWWFMLAIFAENAIRIPLQKHLDRSAEVYMVAHFIEVILAIFLVMELYRLALAAHSALARYGRRGVGYMLAGAALVAGASLLVFPILGPGRSRILYYFLAFERTMDSAVALFLFFASAFMLWFPVRIPKNVAVFIGGFVTYFITRWAGLLTIGVRRALVNDLDVAMMSLSLVCLIAWALLLRPEGERVSTVTGHRWNPVEMERLGRQLTAINARLEKLSGKSNYISLHS